MRLSTIFLALVAAATTAAQTTSIQNGFAAYTYTYRISANSQCLKTYWAAIKRTGGSSCSGYTGDVPTAASESTAGAEGICLCSQVAYNGVSPATTLDFDSYVACVEGLGRSNVKDGMISACRDGNLVASASTTGGSGGSAATSGGLTQSFGSTSGSTSLPTSTSRATATSTGTTTATTTATTQGSAANSLAPANSLLGLVVAMFGLLA